MILAMVCTSLLDSFLGVRAMWSFKLVERSRAFDSFTSKVPAKSASEAGWSTVTVIRHLVQNGSLFVAINARNAFRQSSSSSFCRLLMFSPEVSEAENQKCTTCDE